MFIIVFVLFTINVILFAKTIILTDAITKLESEMEKNKIENRELERQLYTAQSLDRLNKQAVRLGFVKKAEPIPIDMVRFAQAFDFTAHE